MNKKRMTQIIVGIAGILLLCAGVGLTAFLVMPGKTNPPVVQEPNWDSAQTRDLAERACFDCHSNQTHWPWYSYIPPVSSSISHEVQEGRAELNFSEWPSGETDDLIEVILEGEMPPDKYMLLHPEARLSNTETKALISGLQATFGGSIGEYSAEEGDGEFEQENSEAEYEDEGEEQNDDENEQDDDENEEEDEDDDDDDDDDGHENDDD